MKLNYKIIRDVTDRARNIRAVVEEALVPGEGWVIRSTVYTSEHMATGETFVPDYTMSSGKEHSRAEHVTMVA